MTTIPLRIPNVTYCACGSPLHYRDPAVFRQVQSFVEARGPDLIMVAPGGSYRVQRHSLALHGLKVNDLPELARLGIIQRIEVSS
jgi:hypothetical protein